MTDKNMKKPENVNEYIRMFPTDKRNKLEILRKLITDSTPDSIEGISYGMPSYKHGCKAFAGFAAYDHHIGFYVFSSSFLNAFEDDLKTYNTSAGTIRFPLDKTLPVELIKKLIKARVNSIENL